MSIALPGFADPVIDAQSAFRAILDAMSRPGTIRTAGAGLTPPQPLFHAAAAVLLTLVDADTALHLASEFEDARDWIAFHGGAAFAPAIGAADFVLSSTLPDLTSLCDGSDDGPEGGATVIVQVQALGADTGTPFRIAGPGLEVPCVIHVAGLPEDFAAAWAANHARFPRGVDLILCAGAQLMALPRSLSLTREG